MYWIGLVAAALVVALALGIWWATRDRTPVPSGEQIDLETLRSTLDRAGIDRDSTRIPDAGILQPHISERDEFLGAVQARRGNKRTILVALQDRLVAGEATLGTMGAEVITLGWEEIETFDQSYDIGGELRVETRSDAYTFTHLPRSQTREFAAVAEAQIDEDTTS